MLNFKDFIIDEFNNDGKGKYDNKTNIILFVSLLLFLSYCDLQTNTLLILMVVYFIHQKYISKQNDVIKTDKKKKNFKNILHHKDSHILLKIFNKLYKFKTFNKRSYKSGKKHYNKFLNYIDIGDRGNENLKHIYDLAVTELNESLNTFISITVSIPAVSSYKKGKKTRDLELDNQLIEVCKELYEYSINALEHLLDTIHVEWETNKNINSSNVDRHSLRLPKANNVNDILYNNNFNIFNI
jgi:hypothetical protein